MKKQKNKDKSKFFKELQNLIDKHKVNFYGEKDCGGYNVVNFVFSDEPNSTYEVMILNKKLDVLKNETKQIKF